MHRTDAHPRTARFAALGLLALALSFATTGCYGSRTLADPMVQVRTEGGSELGVSTEYGVLFLGRSATRGRAQIQAWFGDGPSLERSVVEPLGDGLFTAEAEIRLPDVPLSFREPVDGEELTVRGRTSEGAWTSTARVVRDERVRGVLLEWDGAFVDAADQVGAGVFRPVDDYHQELVGLVSGKVVLDRPEGRRTFLAVVGPESTWRLVTHRRDLLRRKPWVYREDIL